MKNQMDFPNKKSEQAKIIRSLFSAIKKDNLAKVEELLQMYPMLLYFKNNKRENILFYAFEHNSKSVIDYIHLLDSSLVKEKNILNLNILHELVLQNKDVGYFLENMRYWDNNDIQQLFLNTDPQGNNIILMAAKSGNVSTLEKIINDCPFFDNLQKNSNLYGQTVAHFIASNIFDDCEEIIKKLNPQLMFILDNINGFSPLMLAAYYQEQKNFQAFFELAPKNQISVLGNHLIHFAANNRDSEVMQFLNKNRCFTNENNRLEESPLFIALSKNNIEVAFEIFNQAKISGIKQNEIVAASKLVSVAPKLFEAIIQNKTNEALSDENKNIFLENLFLHGGSKDILNVSQNVEFAKMFVNLDFCSLFAKSLTGKKSMSFKTDFLIKGRNLTKEETISAVISLSKLPANQINSILKTTNLLDSVMLEYKNLFVSLFLAKGLDDKFLKKSYSINPDDDVQRLTKSLFKSSRIENSEKHLANAEHWLELFNDKKVVWKHYGRLVSKHDNPFNFLESKFNFLSRENKKSLVFYTITALFKNEKLLDQESLEIISQHKNLLKNVFLGIIKYGKIPYNQELLNLVPQTEPKLLVTEDLINFLRKTSKKSRDSINVLKQTISMFNLEGCDNIRGLCRALRGHAYHDEIIEEINLLLGKDSFVFIHEYLKGYVSDANAPMINMPKVEKILLSHENSCSIIDDVLEEAIVNKDFQNTQFIKRLRELHVNSSILDKNYAQNFLNENNFDSLNKIQKAVGRELDVKQLDFSKFNWQSIQNRVILKDAEFPFFDFINKNKNSITNQQIYDLTCLLVEQINLNNISFETIEKFLVALDKRVFNIEDDLLLNITSEVLKKRQVSDIMVKFLSQDSFNNIFSLVSQHKKGKFLELIKENEHFELIQQETKIIINKEVLDHNLTIKPAQHVSSKRLKI